MKISIFYSLSLIKAGLISNTYTDHIEIQQLAKFSANPVFPGFNQQLLFDLAKDGSFDIAQKLSRYARSEHASRKIRNRQQRNYKNFLRHFMQNLGSRSKDTPTTTHKWKKKELNLVVAENFGHVAEPLDNVNFACQLYLPDVNVLPEVVYSVNCWDWSIVMIDQMIKVSSLYKSWVQIG